MSEELKCLCNGIVALSDTVKRIKLELNADEAHRKSDAFRICAGQPTYEDLLKMCKEVK